MENTKPSASETRNGATRRFFLGGGIASLGLAASKLPLLPIPSEVPMHDPVIEEGVKHMLRMFVDRPGIIMVPNGEGQALCYGQYQTELTCGFSEEGVFENLKQCLAHRPVNGSPEQMAQFIREAISRERHAYEIMDKGVRYIGSKSAEVQNEILQRALQNPRFVADPNAAAAMRATIERRGMTVSWWQPENIRVREPYQKFFEVFGQHHPDADEAMRRAIESNLRNRGAKEALKVDGVSDPIRYRKLGTVFPESDEPQSYGAKQITAKTFCRYLLEFDNGENEAKYAQSLRKTYHAYVPIAADGDGLEFERISAKHDVMAIPTQRGLEVWVVPESENYLQRSLWEHMNRCVSEPGKQQSRER